MRKVNLLRCDIARDVTAQQVDLSHVFALPYLCNFSVWKVWTNIPLFKQGAKYGA